MMVITLLHVASRATKGSTEFFSYFLWSGFFLASSVKIFFLSLPDGSFFFFQFGPCTPQMINGWPLIRSIAPKQGRVERQTDRRMLHASRFDKDELFRHDSLGKSHSIAVLIAICWFSTPGEIQVQSNVSTCITISSRRWVFPHKTNHTKFTLCSGIYINSTTLISSITGKPTILQVLPPFKDPMRNLRDPNRWLCSSSDRSGLKANRG